MRSEARRILSERVKPTEEEKKMAKGEEMPESDEVCSVTRLGADLHGSLRR